jgi:hypothetical protein
MCNCKEEEKTGTTTVMCCNICGMPDDPAWSVNQWISVEDRLPEDDEPVLACFVGWDDMKFIRVLEYYSQEKEWEDWNCITHSNVTHWMPLPQPPQSILNNVYISEVKK